MISDKIKVRMPYNINLILINDACDFGIVKSNDEPNIGGFLNNIIPTMFKIKKAKREWIHEEMKSRMEIDLIDSKQEKLLDLFDNVYDEIYNVEERSVFKEEVLWIRPNKDTRKFFEEIYEEELTLTGKSLSGYLRDLLTDYAKHLPYQREQMYFRNEFEEIKVAINNQNGIKFRYYENRYKLLPMYIHITPVRKEGNYLMGYDLDDSTIKVFKLKYIRDLVVISKKPKIDDDVIDSCIKTISNIVEEYQYTERDVFEITDGA